MRYEHTCSTKHSTCFYCEDYNTYERLDVEGCHVFDDVHIVFVVGASEPRWRIGASQTFSMSLHCTLFLLNLLLFLDSSEWTWSLPKKKQYFKKSRKILLKASQADELPEIDVLVLSRSKMTRTHVTLFRFRTKVQTNCLRRANDSARAIHQNSSISSKLSWWFRPSQKSFQ